MEREALTLLASMPLMKIDPGMLRESDPVGE
jgi:hypothetical protein